MQSQTIKNLLIGESQYGGSGGGGGGQGHGALYQDLHEAIEERNISYSGGGKSAAAARIMQSKKEQKTRDTLKKATKVIMEMNRKQEDALKRHIQKASDPEDFRGFIYPYQLIPEEEYIKINDAINEYYKLKDKYENIMKKKRKRLMDDPAISWNTLTAQQKAKRLSIIKPSCILCKQDGGTIFTEKEGRLKAICGNISQPCGLHIEVERGKYESLEKLMTDSLEDARATKDEIIRMKLDVLFQFITEEEVVEKFEGVQHKLQEQLKMYAEFRTYYLNVIDNEDIRKDTENLTRVISDKISQIKNYIREFKETDGKNKSLIDDILVIYQDDIEPAYSKIREHKYVYSQVETNENINGGLIDMYDDGEFYLTQKKYSFHELYMPVIMPKWIADNRIISKPVGHVVAPDRSSVQQREASASGSASGSASAAPWYKGKTAELKAIQLAKIGEREGAAVMEALR